MHKTVIVAVTCVTALAKTLPELALLYIYSCFCSGDWSEKEAFFAALETWPKDVRPAVHWSESQPDRKPHAHSDYITGPMNLHGKEADVDVMIEAKCKERTLLRFRDGAPEEAEPVSQADSVAELATKFL